MSPRVKCNRCGGCCEGIWIRNPKYQFTREPNGDFCRKHWHRLSRAKARARIGEAKFDSYDWKGFFFYWCDQFDVGNRFCLAHKIRPQVCRGFPHYGKKVKPDIYWHFPRCSYLEKTQDAVEALLHES